MIKQLETLNIDSQAINLPIQPRQNKQIQMKFRKSLKRQLTQIQNLMICNWTQSIKLFQHKYFPNKKIIMQFL
ncbi:unnamed protein product [Paramecium primaurelia]|uniref:Uncharacterized protein n=1 Tax=Paramecium primaurelia TaxID=5886 RepID=A0A8S1KW93_PARPR|nr:unnamed protein product [Paramecium primaurelia]